MVATDTQLKRIGEIRAGLASLGMTNPLLIAGLAYGESGLAHCHSESPNFCKGPNSNYCNGPVAAGKWDVPKGFQAPDSECEHKMGGLGLMQLDSGSHDETLAKWGQAVIDSPEASVAAALKDHIMPRAIESMKNIGRPLANEQEVIRWMNSIPADFESRAFKEWLWFLSFRYNGFTPCDTVNGRQFAEPCSKKMDVYRAGYVALQGRVGDALVSASSPSAEEPLPDDTQDEVEPATDALPPADSTTCNLGDFTCNYGGTCNVRATPTAQSQLLATINAANGSFGICAAARSSDAKVWVRIVSTNKAGQVSIASDAAELWVYVGETNAYNHLVSGSNTQTPPIGPQLNPQSPTAPAIATRTSGWFAAKSDRQQELGALASSRTSSRVQFLDGTGWASGNAACTSLGLSSCLHVIDWENQSKGCTASVEPSRMVYCQK